MEFREMTAAEIGQKIKAGEMTAVDAVKAALAEIKQQDEVLNSFVTVDEEGALKRAEEVQKRINSGELTGPLAGVPIAIKDNMCTKGLKTTCSSKILYNFEPTYSAEAVLNLEKAGTDCDRQDQHGRVRHGKHHRDLCLWRYPQSLEHGACARAVPQAAPARLWLPANAPCALGSDTGGSIRQPSSFCGVTGIKPTYGTVSRYGLIAYGSSLDQIGPVAKDVTDCALLLEAIASYDTKDSTSVKRESYDFTSALKDDVKGLRIGIPRDYFGEGLDPEVAAAVLGGSEGSGGEGRCRGRVRLKPGGLRHPRLLCHRFRRGQLQPGPF